MAAGLNARSTCCRHAPGSIWSSIPRHSTSWSGSSRTKPVTPSTTTSGSAPQQLVLRGRVHLAQVLGIGAEPRLDLCVEVLLLVGLAALAREHDASPRLLGDVDGQVGGLVRREAPQPHHEVLLVPPPG